MDISESRQQRISENSERLRLTMTQLVGDARAPPETLEPESFDAILADVPCSATGVIRRNPDSKILRQASDIAFCEDQQFSILQGLWPLLKPGGGFSMSLALYCEKKMTTSSPVSRSPSECFQPDAPTGHRDRVWVANFTRAHGTDGLFFSLLENHRIDPAALKPNVSNPHGMAALTWFKVCAGRWEGPEAGENHYPRGRTGRRHAR